jgi:uncharacterized peroxidase-related enzyme
MPFINHIRSDDAPEELKNLYRRFGGEDGDPDMIFRIMGQNPPVMEAACNLFQVIMREESSLSHLQREMIAVVVSGLYHSQYGMRYRWTSDRSHDTLDTTKRLDLLQDYRTADLSDLDVEILIYAERLSMDPPATARIDAERLINQYFSQVQVTEKMFHDIVQVISFVNYICRVAEGLGLEPERY